MKDAPPSQHLLIVDDDPEVSDTLAEILARSGYRIETVSSGRAAQEQLRAGRFDAVLSDFRMADLDGLALHRWVQENRPDLARRFILITGAGFDPETARRVGAAGIPTIDKPFTPVEIRRSIGALLAD